MHLIFLGTASCCPSKHRAASCTAVRFNDGDIWLFDCGEGSQLQIEHSKVHIGKVKKIFITHLHGDHLFGLPGVICTIGTISRADNDFILELYGPLGLRRYLREALTLSRSLVNIKYVVHELIPLGWQYEAKDVKNWKISEEGDNELHPQEILGKQIECAENIWTLFQDTHATVKAGTLVHRIPSFGFSILINPSPGTLKPQLLIKKGLQPGPSYAKLKEGKAVTLKNGEIIHPEDVMDPPIPGLKLTILGDTCDSSGMSDIAFESDILVHEATLEDSMRGKAIERGHSTPSMAAAFAHQIKAKHLVLFHFSQRYKQTDGSKSSVKILQNEAIEALQGLNHDCKVTLAEDLLVMNLSQQKNDD